ncbi:Importin subunit beta-1 [Phytophthora cactorum]|uniref:Importin subunit beta-1 n=1 Tax=Phytophthora cactorum TaxID=29920 RepID=A0A8T1F7V3_9STRA|nr:Importin subunit beta-1 [Phytophthora cactorum]KAG2964432.1 Importin subunit beta-1 [Phytophthora cactorum]KAG3010188.1 Importin subunit beta-1 [Phytophthora cactorum]
MDISAALLNTQSPDLQLRKQAEEFLNNALQQQMGQFMVTLVQALASEEFAVVGRQAAGLYLKNVLDAKDDALQQQKINAWMAMDAALRTQIKDGSLGVLQSNDPVARHTSAQLVAKIGSIELPQKEWPTLLESLLQNVTSGSEGCIHATLECLGYLCDELEEGAIDELDTNRILTAIVDGIRTDRPPAIRLAAITALRNSLEFVSENFKRKQERDHLMQKICEATQSPDLRTRVVAYECIAAIATMYYEYLAEYMETLCKLTFNAITSDQDEVGLQSLEFWSSMCDVELDLIEEMNYAQLENRTDYIPCNYYVQTVLNTLIPLLTETLKKQEDDQDEDSWNLSMAAATCLALVAQVVGDACVDLTMTFITQNIESNEWRPKEAAIMAFGSILDGPDSAKIAPLVRQALGFLMGCMKFDNILVRDTTAWTLGRICLDQEPRVSHNVCYAIHNIVKAFEESEAAAHMLTPYFKTLFDKLLETSNRPNATESNLRGSAYEALNVLVQAGADEVNEHIMLRLPVVLERLEQSIKALIENPNSLHDDQAGLQALLCGVLIAAIQKLNTDIEPLADRIMQALLQVFSTRNAAAAEEAFMAAGALANVVGPKFEVYMQYFGPVVLMGLKNSEEYMVCSVAVGVVGDLCRSLEGKILPLCDEIVAALIEILKNPMLNRSVKPPVLSCFGDIALAIEGEYERYAVSSLQMILQAAGACGSIATDDEEVVEYMNQLRESVLEALTGIVQGLGAANKAAMLLECAPQIGAFLATLANDLSTRSDAVTTGAVGLIGDMGQAMGKAVETLFHQQFAVQLVTECANNAQNPQAQQLAAWTQKVIMDLQAN